MLRRVDGFEGVVTRQSCVEAGESTLVLGLLVVEGKEGGSASFLVSDEAILPHSN